MAKYHITGIFVVANPAEAATEVFTSALHGQTGVDTAVVVTPSSVEPSVLENIGRLFEEAGIEYQHIAWDQDESLATGLADVVATSQETARMAETQSWLWFITDDGVVNETTLANQLKAVEISPSVAVAGAKQLSDRHLINVGLTVARNGDVLSMIEPGELDQGQYDHRTDTFAVSLLGMLIKTDVWVDLEGFDTLTPELAQTVDVCWRARLAGHRVAVVPSAEVQHETAAVEPDIADAWAASRWLRLKHTGLFGFIGGWIWGWFAALGVLLAGLFVKDPGTGVAQARGIIRTLMRPVALWSSQKEARSSRTRPYDAVAELRPSRARVRDHRRSVLEVSVPDRVVGDGTGSSSTPQQATGGHDDFEELA
ncbi:MAG: glycosyltransferase, partial [Yaniella sp.]|nr:glycosyltransferase [Yaniella sp.]